MSELHRAIHQSVRQHLARTAQDRKSTRLNSSHGYISYAVFCLKKKYHTTTSLYRSLLITTQLTITWRLPSFCLLFLSLVLANAKSFNLVTCLLPNLSLHPTVS